MTELQMQTEHVSKPQAVLLALHATYVQGGFSTPEIEAERAEKDIAAGGQIDWDKIQAEVFAAGEAATQAKAEEAEAAELEGLAPMPADLIPLRDEKLLLDKQKEALEGRLKEIKDTFGERLKQDNLQGFTLHGKVHARRSPGTRTGVDVKKLKIDMPHIYSQYLKSTSYVSIRID